MPPPSPPPSHLAGSRRDQQQAYFIGGSEELQDVTYMAQPQGHKGSVLNKYGYKTVTSGNVKVGVCCGGGLVVATERLARWLAGWPCH